MAKHHKTSQKQLLALRQGYSANSSYLAPNGRSAQFAAKHTVVLAPHVNRPSILARPAPKQTAQQATAIVAGPKVVLSPPTTGGLSSNKLIAQYQGPLGPMAQAFIGSCAPKQAGNRFILGRKATFACGQTWFYSARHRTFSCNGQSYTARQIKAQFGPTMAQAILALAQGKGKK